MCQGLCLESARTQLPRCQVRRRLYGHITGRDTEGEARGLETMTCPAWNRHPGLCDPGCPGAASVRGSRGAFAALPSHPPRPYVNSRSHGRAGVWRTEDGGRGGGLYGGHPGARGGADATTGNVWALTTVSTRTPALDWGDSSKLLKRLHGFGETGRFLGNPPANS